MSKPTCTVVFADGTNCERDQKYVSSGWCRVCWTWSRNNGGADPNGRADGRKRPTPQPCSVTFSDETPCPRTAESTVTGWCEPCATWSRKHKGADPNGRKRHRRPGEDRPQCTVILTDGRRCTGRQHTKTWCQPCYDWSRNHRESSPDGRPASLHSTYVIAAAEQASKATTDECVFLPNYTTRPTTSFEGKPMFVSRIVWILANGDPGELHVLHTCHQGEEGCINIRHLYLGDNDLNIADKLEAGRQAKGTQCWSAVLDEDKVQVIRREHSSEGRGRGFRTNAHELAARFGVSVSTINDVVSRRSWRHVQ